jgi:hypothetical protein
MTVLCIAVVIGSLFLAGAPVVWLLAGRRPLEEGDCVRAPFLGLAVIVLVLQNLVYLDVPLRWSTPWMWGAILLTWLVLAWRRRQGDCLRPVLGVVLAGVVAIYLLQGLGMLRLGTARYVGRCWTDQFNYVALAQTLMDEPFHTPIEDAQNRPLTALTWHIKHDRIGQSVLHGFYAVTCGWDAKSLFEPTILLLPPLAAAAVFALGRRLGLSRGRAVLTAAAVGLLPSLALLHLESFFSHALGVPFLILFPLLLVQLVERPGPGNFLAAALCMGAGCSIYMEFSAILEGLVLLALLAVAVKRGRSWRTIGWPLGLMVAPLVLLPGYLPNFLDCLLRIAQPVCQDVYPWAVKLEGLGRLWFGDLPFAYGKSSEGLAELCGLALTSLAAVGLGWACLKHLRGALQNRSDEKARGAALLSVAILAVSLLPVAVLLRDSEHPYQVYKLLISISPLLVLGVALALLSARKKVVVILAAVGALMAVGTGDMLWRSTRAERVPRTIAWMLLDPNMSSVARRLEQVSSSNLLIATEDVTINPWLAYYGRRNPLWVNTDRINDTSEPTWPHHHMSMFHLEELPPSPLILGSKLAAFDFEPPPGMRLEWSNGAYQLYATTGRNWALPATFRGARGCEQREGKPVVWLGKDGATLEIIAGSPTTLALHGKFVSDRAVSLSSSCCVIVSRDRGPTSWAPANGSELALEISLPAGKTALTLAVQDTAGTMQHATSERSTPCLGIQGLQVSCITQNGPDAIPGWVKVDRGSSELPMPELDPLRSER